MNPRVSELLSVLPYRIVARWTDGVVRSCDFKNWFLSGKSKESLVLSSLFDPLIFTQAQVYHSTIGWPNLLPGFEESDKPILTELDLCPDKLLAHSVQETDQL